MTVSRISSKRFSGWIQCCMSVLGHCQPDWRSGARSDGNSCCSTVCSCWMNLAMPGWADPPFLGCRLSLAMLSLLL
jgi:hypothetical protein